MLLDFNAAKQFSGQNESDTVLIGTPGYAAPEQYGFGSSSPKISKTYKFKKEIRLLT
jgi:serine/threonine protein kinase